jgi:hypothetical protein
VIISIPFVDIHNRNFWYPQYELWLYSNNSKWDDVLLWISTIWIVIIPVCGALLELFLSTIRSNCDVIIGIVDVNNSNCEYLQFDRNPFWINPYFNIAAILSLRRRWYGSGMCREVASGERLTPFLPTRGLRVLRELPRGQGVLAKLWILLFLNRNMQIWRFWSTLK